MMINTVEPEETTHGTDKLGLNSEVILPLRVVLIAHTVTGLCVCEVQRPRLGRQSLQGAAWMVV